MRERERERERERGLCMNVLNVNLFALISIAT